MNPDRQVNGIGPDHPCRQLTQPALEILGIAVVIIGAYLFWKRE